VSDERIKIECFIDNQANAHSKRRFVVPVKRSVWDDMDDDQRKDFIWDQLVPYIDCGYTDPDTGEEM